jgi:hypothetical protein
MPTWAALALGVGAVVAVALWAWRTHGRGAAAVVVALGGCTLVILGLAYGPVPIETWRDGHLDRTLAVFALPAVAAVAIALVRHRGNLAWRGWLFIACLWLGPSLLVWGSQLRPFTVPEGNVGVGFANLAWFAGWSIAIYIAVPVAYARAVGDSIRGYGLSTALLRREWVAFALSVPALLAAVWFFAAEERFAAVYPFLRDPASWGQLLLWEVLYGATFIALEFFFRGFIVFAGRPVLGIHIVPIMAFSYCLIHLAKPLPEAVSSLIGGLVLGYVALRFRSILVGVAAHLTLAWGMDASVLVRR